MMAPARKLGTVPSKYELGTVPSKYSLAWCVSGRLGSSGFQKGS